MTMYVQDGAHNETSLLMTASACDQPVAVLKAVTWVSYSSDPLELQPGTVEGQVPSGQWMIVWLRKTGKGGVQRVCCQVG